MLNYQEALTYEWDFNVVASPRAEVSDNKYFFNIGAII